jgi:hypothetical protein
MQEATKEAPNPDTAESLAPESGVVFLGEVYQETRNAVSFGFGDDQFKFFSIYD